MTSAPGNNDDKDSSSYSSSYISSTDKDEQEQDETWLLAQLSAEQVEIAARANYSYLCNPSPKDQNRKESARDFVQRYVRSISQRPKEKVLERIKATLNFRKEIDVDGLRQAFDSDNTSSATMTTDNTSTSKDNKKTLELEKHLENKSLYVQGYDKEGRSTYIFVTGNVTSHDEEWTIKSHVYTLERALACTKSTDGKVNAVIDFKDFSLYSNAPPMNIAKQFMTTFRDHYAGCIHRIFLIDAPTSFYVIWRVVEGFIGTYTREKIQFIDSSSSLLSSSHSHSNALAALYDKDQLASWMTQGGTMDDQFDLREYLYETPFDAAFGEVSFLSSSSSSSSFPENQET